MTRKPQKAKAKNKAGSKKKEQKRERRMAPEFTLVWSSEATNAVNGRSGELVKAVYASAYARIYRAEAALCGAIDVVQIGRVDPIHSFDRWWAPFRVHDLWFELR